MLHKRHRLSKTGRNRLFRFILCFMLFTFLYFLSFPLFSLPLSLFFPSFFLIFFYLSFCLSEVPSFLCVSFVNVSTPVDLQLYTWRGGRLSAISERYVTAYARGFGHCASTEVCVIYRPLGS
jgi:hypothetical protein